MHTRDELDDMVEQLNPMAQELRESYAALKDREERLALVIQGTNDGIWDWNLQTNEIYLSPRGKEMLGYEDREIGSSIEELKGLIHPDDLEHVQSELQPYLNCQCEIDQLEIRVRHKNGAYRWILARGAALRDANGKSYRMAGSFTDVTERKQADEAIRQSEKRFSQAFHGSPVPIVMMMPLGDGRYVEVNDAWLRFFGFTRDEAIGNTSLGLNLWAKPEQRLLMIEQLQATGSVRNEEYLARTKSGELRNVLVSAETLELNGQPYLLSYIYDITDRKQAEETIRQSEKRFSQAFHACPVPIIMTAPLDDARFVEVNDAWMRFTGYTLDEAIGNTWRELKTWVDPEQRVLMVRQLQATGSVRNQECLTQTKAGELRTVLLSAETLELNGQPYILYFINDVTELKQTQQVLEERVAARTHQLATLNEIAAVVNRSLDLNEIMNAALSTAMEMMHIDVGAAYSLQEVNDWEGDKLLVLVAQRGLSAEFSRRVGSIRVDREASEVAAEAGQPDVGLVAHYPNSQIREALEIEEVRQYVHVPLVAKGKLVGAFNLGSHHIREIKPEELSLLASIGQQIAVAVENGILYRKAEESAAIAERQRLSRELHDSVTQSLYSVTMYAEAAARLLASGDNSTAAKHLRELRDTAQEALREMRLLIFQLRPLPLEKVGLAAALQARLDSVEARSGVQTKFQVEGVQAPELILRPVEEELYHIAQEALNNALKHSHAKQIRVHLRFSDIKILLEIYDDGVGFTPSSSASGGGLGLNSLKERAQKIGARLDIESAPDQGTQISVVVPVRPG